MRTYFKPWVAPGLLFLLGTISIAFGALQLTLLQLGETDATKDLITAHYVSIPVPIVIHIICGSLFNLLMPLQFAAQLRSRFPGIHRGLGRCLVLCGVGFGLSALWMNEVYPPYGGNAKYLGIMTHSLLLFGSLAMAIWAIKKRRVTQHRIWMMRAAATALSPATQRLFFLPAMAIFGEEIATDAVIGFVIWFGLIVNLGVVQWVISSNNLSAHSAHTVVGEHARDEQYAKNVNN